MSTGAEQTITLTDDGDWWIAKDTETGVASQGKTREGALSNLDEALAGYQGEGREPTDEELRERASILTRTFPVRQTPISSSNLATQCRAGHTRVKTYGRCW